jgi:protein-disulfide isomerase
VRFIFREYPHNDAGLAAFMLARCAPKDQYFPLIDVLFDRQPTWTADPREELRKLAAQAGFTTESFETCLKDEALARNILDVRNSATAAGVDGVPALFINGERFYESHDLSAVRAYIDSLL